MDQIKIGRFIATCRKQNGLTQAQLAEKLNITDRAVSKWETGKSMPDSSIMLDLCRVLKISVNDLLCGEKLTVDNYSNEMEKNLLETIRQKEEADKRLLSLETVLGFGVTLVFLVILLVATYVPMDVRIQTALIAFGFIIFIVGCLYGLRIEQVAGYYLCDLCGNRYVPKYIAVNMAPHIGRKRYMRCPKCNQRSWQKKVISKE